MLNSSVAEGSGGELLFDFAEAGKHAEEAFEWSQILDHFHLIEEVVEVELSGLKPFGGLHCFLFVDLVGHLLNHGDDVPHA